MLDIIQARRSSRDFDPLRPVEQEKIDEIVKAGLLAPSGMNRQDGIVIVIKDKEVREELARINGEIMGRSGDPFYGAPVILLIACKKNPYPDLDGGAMIENMLLEATAQGLGSCWIHRAKEEWKRDDFRKLLAPLGIAYDDYVGVDHIALGYTLGGKPREKLIKEGRVYQI